MIEVRGKVHNVAETSRAIGQAPELFRKRIAGWLYSERNSFVGGYKGGRRTHGTFTRKLARKESVKGTPWQTKVVNAFRGEVENKGQIEGMKLVMGVNLKRSGRGGKYGYPYTGAPMPEILKLFEGGAQIQSGGYMIVPIYNNLPSKNKPWAQFRQLNDSGQLRFAFSGDRIYYFKHNYHQGQQGDLVFVGLKRVAIRSQYDFDGAWKKRVPKAIDRGQKRIDRLVMRINKGERVHIPDWGRK